MATTPTSPKGDWRGNLSLASRRYGDLFRDRDASTLLLAAVGSAIGDWLNFVAVVIIASNIGGGELAVGGALAIRFVPRLIFQGPAGALVDRFPGRILLASSQMLMGVIAGSFLLLERYREIWLLFALVFLLESVYTIARPAFAVQVLRIVPAGRRSSANAVLGTGLTGAQFVGGWLGGVLMSAWGDVPLFVINGLSFFVLAGVVLSVRTNVAPHVDEAEATSSPEISPHFTTPSGYAGLLRVPDIRSFLAQQLSILLLIQATVALFVARSIELNRVQSEAGTLISMVGLGLILGSALGGIGVYLGPTALVIVAAGELFSAAALVGFGLVDTWPLALAALVGAGIGSQISDIAGMTYFQNHLPERVYGRFLSLYLIALSTGGLVGSLLGPLLNLRQSVGTSLLIIAVPAIVSSCWLWRIALIQTRARARDPRADSKSKRVSHRRMPESRR
ncbi:MAG: MFS transporter [Gemmatimonadota bacterium]|nr:MFS transporter [Gemmatimonadota bacterium]